MSSNNKQKLIYYM